MSGSLSVHMPMKSLVLGFRHLMNYCDYTSVFLGPEWHETSWNQHLPQFKSCPGLSERLKFRDLSEKRVFKTFKRAAVEPESMAWNLQGHPKKRRFSALDHHLYWLYVHLLPFLNLLVVGKEQKGSKKRSHIADDHLPHGALSDEQVQRLY